MTGSLAGPGVALQLYTVRQQFHSDPLACLQAVAAAGFESVELAGFAGLEPDDLRAALDDAGLRAISSHIDIPEFEDDLGGVIERHLILGCEAVVIQQAALADFASADAVHRLAERANGWGAAMAESGLRLGYHGYHDFDQEFAVDNGRRRYDVFTDETDPRYVDIQLDTFWVQYVGDDPAQSLHRLRGRVPMLHTKEIREGGGDAPIGTGSTDWTPILQAAIATGVRWLVVEQEDDPEHALQNIVLSRRNLLAELADVLAAVTA